MAKSKKGHVAIPFLLAFLLGIVCIGGIAMYLFNRISSKEGIQKMHSSVVQPTAEDSCTLLFVLDEPEDASPLTFVIARVIPEDKRIMLLSLPSNMLSIVNDKQDTLAGFYRKGGIQSVMDAIESEAEIRTDRYIILDSESFQKICNIFAGVYYQIPVGTQGFADSSEPQYLGPSQIEKLITNPFFEKGESQRSSVVADVLCEMINQTDYDRIEASMDSSFRTLINMMNTNISSIDYSDHRAALKFMYTYGSRICTFRLATGTTSEDNIFVLNTDFYDSIKEFFPENSENSGNQDNSVTPAQAADNPENSDHPEESGLES
ncbi:MAG: LCP family protein [Oscillospiraceae bacterium]|nr:LCP family protein [Oscillospiraceae bacterium]MDE5884792.1 LCP family protein [Oscillospiraceae bacterium]